LQGRKIKTNKKILWKNNVIVAKTALANAGALKAKSATVDQTALANAGAVNRQKTP